MDVPGSSSQRLVDLCERIGASKYVTGHGAFHYLDHALFESRGVGVRYMRYQRRAYAQPHGEFTPHVTVRAEGRFDQASAAVFGSSTRPSTRQFTTALNLLLGF